MKFNCKLPKTINGLMVLVLVSSVDVCGGEGGSGAVEAEGEGDGGGGGRGGEEVSAESVELSNLVVSDESKEVLAELEEKPLPQPPCVTDAYDNSTRLPAEQGNSTSSSESGVEEGAGFPYVVSLQRRAAHVATGALLRPRWVLSAAAPFYYVRESIKLYRAHMGSADCKRGAALRLARVELHPGYQPQRPALDVALLQLAAPALLSAYVQPIALSTVTDKLISAKFITAYWPTLIVDGRVLPASAQERVRPSSLRVSTQRLIPRQQCAAQLQQRGETLPVTSLCLRPVIKFHSVCMPDAGAAVVAADGLWAVGSGWAPRGCASGPPPPALATRLALPAVHTWLIAILH